MIKSIIPNKQTPSGSKVIVWAFSKENAFKAIFDHLDGDFFHVYWNDEDFGKKKYKTIGFENCELIRNYVQMELF